MPQYQIYLHTNEHTLRFENWQINDHDRIELSERPVAVVTADNLEDAFAKTQHDFFNDEMGWFGMERDGVKLMIRSTMVGDVFVEVDAFGPIGAHVVKPMGFEEYRGSRQKWYGFST